MTAHASALPVLALAHLGALHTHERILVLLLAFGPFLLLAVVMVVIRRRDAAQVQREQDQSAR